MSYHNGGGDIKRFGHPTRSQSGSYSVTLPLQVGEIACYKTSERF